MSKAIRNKIFNLIEGVGSSGSSQSSLFTEIIDGIHVSMIKRVRTIDGAEEYVVDLKLTDLAFVGVEDTDFEKIYEQVV